MVQHEGVDVERPPRGWRWEETSGDCICLADRSGRMAVEAVRSIGASEAPRIGAERRWVIRWYEAAGEASAVRQSMRVATRHDAAATLYALATAITETDRDEALPDLETVHHERRLPEDAPERGPERSSAGGRQLAEQSRTGSRDPQRRSRNRLREV